MRVELQYLKRTGDWITAGEYESNHTNLYVIWEEVKTKLKEGTLPNVPAQDNIVVIVNVPEHPDNHEHMVFAEGFRRII